MPFPGFRKKGVVNWNTEKICLLSFQDPFFLQKNNGLQSCWWQYGIHPIVPCMWKAYFWWGEMLIYSCSFQTKSQLETLQSLHNKVLDRFVNEKPLHLLGNNTSSFHIIPEQIWAEMSSTHVQEKLKTGAIIITSTIAPLVSFDRELFADMLGHGDMRYVVPMEGKSLYFTNWKFSFLTNSIIQIGLWMG